MPRFSTQYNRGPILSLLPNSNFTNKKSPTYSFPFVYQNFEPASGLLIHFCNLILRRESINKSIKLDRVIQKEEYPYIES